MESSSNIFFIRIKSIRRKIFAKMCKLLYLPKYLNKKKLLFFNVAVCLKFESINYYRMKLNDTLAFYVTQHLFHYSIVTMKNIH